MYRSWNMEAAAAWAPCDYDEEAAPSAYWRSMEPELWAPGFLPVKPSSREMVCFQASPGQQQPLVEYAAAAAQDDDPFEEASRLLQAEVRKMEMQMSRDPIQVFQELTGKVTEAFEGDIEKMGTKIHRYPPSFRSLDEEYTVPKMVAIGPYHRHRPHLEKAERAKHFAAIRCVEESGHSVLEIYGAVVEAADHARSLYDGDIWAGGIRHHEDFRPMMFFDACFLVQYMLNNTSSDEVHPQLHSYFESNDEDIYHDILLLENQIPWRVVETVRRFRGVPLESLVENLRGGLQDRKDSDRSSKTPVSYDVSYEPPHLLGLLRFYIVGRSDKRLHRPETDSVSLSVNAIELAEMGIPLVSNEKLELIHMGIGQKWRFFRELSLTPLSLDRTRASLLVNMAAFEICTISYFIQAEQEASAVCSYLLLLGMVLSREDDVQVLRKARILQGGGGFNDEAVLKFFMSLQCLPLGPYYIKTMDDIEDQKKRKWTKLRAFDYKYRSTIVKVFSAFAALASILATLVAIKDSVA